MPIPLLQAIVVVLSAATLALVTGMALCTARGPRRVLHWLVLWISLAPPIGVGVYLVNRGRDRRFANAALVCQTAGFAMAALFAWLGAGES